MDTTPDPAGARHVFISFASADAELAHRVVRDLEQSGVRCWIADRDIDPAASYPSAITAAITGGGVLLLLLTEAANHSPHVHREVELAFNARRPILPVRLAGTIPTDDLQYFLSRAQWLDAGAGVDDAELAMVRSRIRELLASPAARTGHAPVGPWWRRPGAAVAALAVVAAVGLLSLFSWNERVAPDSPAAPSPDGIPPAPAGPQIKINPRDGQEYVWIPPGMFTMGCSAGDPDCEDDERPVRVVEVTPGFWLGRTETTAGRYARDSVTENAGAAGRRLPASGVSWTAAAAYCRDAGGRLPTEAEWEYAARAGTATRHYDSLPAIAWFAGNSEGAPRPVGTRKPNAFGLHDMLGNVSEWVRDRYYDAYDDTSDPADVEEPLAGNASGVARGGSWLSDARGLRASRRLPMPPDAEEPHIGFRCAMDEL